MAYCFRCEKEFDSMFCPDCGFSQEASKKSAREALNTNIFTRKISYLWLSVAAAFALFIFCGFFRIYNFGSDGGIQIVLKNSLSFKDTYVNLDDIWGTPRFAAEAQHPAVVRQLEEMGRLETSDQAAARIRSDIDRKTRESMDKYKEEYGY